VAEWTIWVLPPAKIAPNKKPGIFMPGFFKNSGSD
jgi:hypothetical protein